MLRPSGCRIQARTCVRSSVHTLPAEEVVPPEVMMPPVLSPEEIVLPEGVPPEGLPREEVVPPREFPRVIRYVNAGDSAEDVVYSQESSDHLGLKDRDSTEDAK